MTIPDFEARSYGINSTVRSHQSATVQLVLASPSSELLELSYDIIAQLVETINSKQATPV